MHIHTVTIKNLTLGEGRPKICVPIVAAARKDILSDASRLHSLPVDLVEWRADWYENVDDTQQVLSTAAALRQTLAKLPLLFTFRTAKEGGARAITTEQYEALNTAVAKSGSVDLIDVEAFIDGNAAGRIIKQAHQAGVRVIASSHDFEKTPPEDELIRRLCRMQELDADIPKIAVMPQSKEDVMTLLSATLKMHERYADRPIITMSMADTGAISRLIGEFSGSAVTFGAAGNASAPGQIDIQTLAQALDIIHNTSH